ncbi:hypothetical protein Thermus77420_15000 [Thermus thalpophilus]
MGHERVDAVLAVARGERYLNPSPAVEMVQREGEEEALRLLAQGLSHKEVADRLAVSAKNVATYRERGMEKLGQGI